VAWRRDDPSALVANLLAVVRGGQAA
jgi:hypothetical protein